MKPQPINSKPAVMQNMTAITPNAMRALYGYFIVALVVIILTLSLLCSLTNACSSSQYFNIGPPFTIFGTTQTDLNMYIGLAFFFYFSATIQTIGGVLAEIAFFTYYYQAGDLDEQYGGLFWNHRGKQGGRWTVYIALCTFNLLSSFFFIINLIGAFSNILFFVASAIGINLTKALVDIPRVFYDQTPSRGDQRKKFLCFEKAQAV